MHPQPAFGYEQLVTELLRGVVEAVADRAGDTEAQRFARHQTTVFTAMALLPRDAVETMTAGQCLITHNLLLDATHDLFGLEAEPLKRRVRPQVIALGRLFLQQLEQLRQLQARPAQQSAASGTEPAAPSEARMPDEDGQPAAEFASPAAPEVSKADLLRQHGFQNRRMRRAQHFKKPAGKGSPRRHSPPSSVASRQSG